MTSQSLEVPLSIAGHAQNAGRNFRPDDIIDRFDIGTRLAENADKQAELSRAKSYSVH